MRSALTVALVASIVASPRRGAAQVPLGPVHPDGPIARAVSLEAARFAAMAQTAAAPASPAQTEGGPAPVEMKWGEIGPIVVNQRVAVAWKDGRTVRGEVLAVRDTELLLETKTDKKGSMTIPRESIAGLTVTRTKGAGGRTFGTIIGILGGMWIGGYTASTTDSAAAGIPIFFGVTTLTGMLGYYGGKQLDTRTTRITIVP
jgi:hypothetical protein